MASQTTDATAGGVEALAGMAADSKGEQPSAAVGAEASDEPVPDADEDDPSATHAKVRRARLAVAGAGAAAAVLSGRLGFTDVVAPSHTGRSMWRRQAGR